MFWLLAGAGVVAAAPCFVVPPIDAYRGLLDLEARERAVVDRLEERIERQAELQNALRCDPMVNFRLAQRELRYRQPGRVAYLPNLTGAQIGYSRVPQRAEPGGHLPEWMNRLYPRRWSAVYQHSNARRSILLMSFAMIVFALATYGGRSAGPVVSAVADRTSAS